MSARKNAGHIIIVAIGVFFLAALPILKSFPILTFGIGADTLSSASYVVPDKPSGDFFVLINTSLHEDTIDDWSDFFSDKDYPVIFDDIKCLVAKDDLPGFLLAERFQAQLPENQMSLRTEDSMLLVSKAEAGLIDAAVFSREMAERLKLDLKGKIPGITVIELKGGEDL